MPGQARAKKKPAPLEGERQTDLAEGEPDTIEESIRIHERKESAQAGAAKPGRKKKDR
jgi:hypothetical protein